MKAFYQCAKPSITTWRLCRYGEVFNLVNNFKRSNIIFNKGEYNTLETELINVLKQKNINFSKSKNTLSIEKYNFYFLNHTIYDNTKNEHEIIKNYLSKSWPSQV